MHSEFLFILFYNYLVVAVYPLSIAAITEYKPVTAIKDTTAERTKFEIKLMPLSIVSAPVTPDCDIETSLQYEIRLRTVFAYTPLKPFTKLI